MELELVGKGELVDCNTRSYESVIKDCNVFSMGDYILVQGNQRKCICQIIRFLQNLTDYQTTAHVRWLYWPQEVTKLIQNIPTKKKPFIPSFSAGEVALSNCQDQVMVTAILEKVFVLELSPSETAPKPLKDGEFYSRWLWDSEKRKFTEIRGTALSLKDSGRAEKLNTTEHPTTTSQIPEQISRSHSHTLTPRIRSASRMRKSGMRRVEPSNHTPTATRSATKSRARSEYGVRHSLIPVVCLTRKMESPHRGSGFLAALSLNQPIPTLSPRAAPSPCLREPSTPHAVPQKPAHSPLHFNPTTCNSTSLSSGSTRNGDFSAGQNWNNHTPEKSTKLVPPSLEECPLPTKRARRSSEPTSNGHKTRGRNVESIQMSSLKRRLNTCDVVGLLSIDEEEEEEEEEEGEEEEEEEVEKNGVMRGWQKWKRDHARKEWVEGNLENEDVVEEEVVEKEIGGKEKRKNKRQETKEEEKNIKDGGKDKEIDTQTTSSLNETKTILSTTESALTPPKKWSLRNRTELKPPEFLSETSGLLQAIHMVPKPAPKLPFSPRHPLESLDHAESVVGEQNRACNTRKRRRVSSLGGEGWVEGGRRRIAKSTEPPKSARWDESMHKKCRIVDMNGGENEEDEVKDGKEEEEEKKKSSCDFFDLKLPKIKTPKGRKCILRLHTLPRYHSSESVAQATAAPSRSECNGGINHITAPNQEEEEDISATSPSEQAEENTGKRKRARTRMRILKSSRDIRKADKDSSMRDAKPCGRGGRRQCSREEAQRTLVGQIEEDVEEEEEGEEYKPSDGESNSSGSEFEEEEPFHSPTPHLSSSTSSPVFERECKKTATNTRRSRRQTSTTDHLKTPTAPRTTSKPPRASSCSHGRGRRGDGGGGGGRTQVTPRRKILTPHIPQRKIMRISALQTKNNMERARLSLHVSAVPHCLPCRENEFSDIFTFVENKLRDGTGGCMYISGVPGTGKTATVREVAEYLQTASQEGDLPEFKFIEINGMRLTEPRQAYCSMLKQLTGERATPDHSASLLDQYFSSAQQTTTVLLADELDLLWTRKQSVLYHLFDWPTRHLARLVVLAVANTMDLPERVMMSRVASRLGLTRLTFQPYTFQQLQEIVSSRMVELDVFEPDAMQLAARKVAAVSGDARRALDICRRATELATKEWLLSSSKRGPCIVNTVHINQAVQEMFSSPKILAIQNSSFHEKMFFKGIVSQFRSTGLEEATLAQVDSQVQCLYRSEGLPVINSSVLLLVCSRLNSSRLILTEGGRKGIQQRIRLNMSRDDVIFALRQHHKTI